MNWHLVIAWAMWLLHCYMVPVLVGLVGGPVFVYFKTEGEPIDRVRKASIELIAFIVFTICVCLLYGMYKVQHPGP